MYHSVLHIIVLATVGHSYSFCHNNTSLFSIFSFCHDAVRRLSLCTLVLRVSRCCYRSSSFIPLLDSLHVSTTLYVLHFLANLSPSSNVSGIFRFLVSGRSKSKNPLRMDRAPGTAIGTTGCVTSASCLMKGAKRAPTLAQVDEDPTPTFLTTVGKISAE